VRKLIYFFIFILIRTANANPSFTVEDYEKIKKVQITGKRSCDTNQVLKSSEILGVTATYSIGGEDALLNETTNKRLLCLIAISTETNLWGHLKSNPNAPERAFDFKKAWPENAYVEEIIFYPTESFNRRCDDDGVPSVSIKFTKTPSGLKRSIDFTLSVYECGAGELNDWLKPRPQWIK
jgi:hypothetical protein